jgi:hypothetical protein
VVSSVLAEIRSALLEIFRMYPEVLAVTTKSADAADVHHAKAPALALVMLVCCVLVIMIIVALVLMVLNPVS